MKKKLAMRNLFRFVSHATKFYVEEEVGLIVDELKYVKSYGYSDKLMLGFFCKAKNADLKISEKELYSAGWFPASEAQRLVRQGSVIKQLLDEYINQYSLSEK